MSTDETRTEAQQREEKLRKAYSTATTRLRDKYRTEFEAMQVAAAQELGVVYTPRQTPAQKAMAEFDALVAAYPALLARAAELAAARAEPVEGEDFFRSRLPGPA